MPLLLSLIDKAIDYGHAFGAHWGSDQLLHVRDGLEYLTFALLEHRLRQAPTTVECSANPD